ncbi:epimerase [Frigoribacterium sp. 2-23]|uniref:epimerase n=1 Tax=Frigoribacterium sp. 2-23 TaxID=3415006 RepID=UPI003C7012E6
MTDHVVIAGASGFIGQHLAEAFRAEGARVSLIGRSGPDARWGDTARITELLDGADLLVNMAGKSVNCRYTPENRAEILRSRVETTRELARAIAACAAPPRLWVNSSTATIYRHADDRPQTESTGEIGTGFSVGIATAWEEAFFEADLPSTRRVALRTAIVLGDGSALVPLIRLAQFGLGGPQIDGRWPLSRARVEAGTAHRFGSADGRQRFSWVHIDDVLGAIRFVRDHDDIDGVVNVSSPNPSDNRSMMRTLRWVLGRPVGLPAFRWMLELGTAALRTETELVLKSRWVLPERLVDAGYEFAHPDLEEALRAIVEDRRRSAARVRRG